MRRPVCTLLLAVMCVAVAPSGGARAQATFSSTEAYTYQPSHDPRPRSGVGGLVVGYVGLGMAGLNLATLPVCFASFYPSEYQGACIGSSVVIGVVELTVGVVGLVIGKRRRSAYKAWRARQRAQLSDVRASLAPGGASLALHYTF